MDSADTAEKGEIGLLERSSARSYENGRENGNSEGSQSLETVDSRRGPGQFLKYAVLLLLVAQNATVVLMMKYSSRTRADDGKHSLSTATVLMVEVAKVLCCSSEVIVRRGGIRGFVAEIHEEIFCKPNESAFLLIPCFLYVCQNNLMFVAISELDPPIFQVISQLKIFTTAIFSILILKSALKLRQWLALLLLVLGCSVTQNDFNASYGLQKGLSSTGLACALGAICTSGLAGVLCEKALKSGSASVSIRNIQLGVPSCVLAVIGMVWRDFDAIQRHGVLQGFTKWTWVVVLLYSMGGLLITLVMKYADNILKGFAIAGSLILSTAVSVAVFNFTMTTNFVTGSILVVIATFLYSMPLSCTSWCDVP